MASYRFIKSFGATAPDPAEESGYDIVTRFPAMAAWMNRMRAVEGWASPYALMPSDRIAPKW